ncbi:MAG: ATP-binding cassette domain-containing protein [Proteobacteria bacterium]|nr:ATP-binding cassette domain-containing protein [Pseudomonadota bacterium]
MPIPCIEYSNITKSYGDKTILDGLSLRITANITTAIVGASGSGKSTLIQLANGLIIPERGQVSVFGSAINSQNITDNRLAIGYSVQGAGLFPHMSVYENITLMATLQRWSEQDTELRFHALMQLLELDQELRDRYPFSLSGGQQQRVSLCRAMMLNPPLLLLDEPFSALDPVTRDSIHREFLKLQHAETRSMVLVTHDMFEAIKLAQEIIVMRDGRIEQQGSVAEIQNNPASDYVQALFHAGGQ